VPQTSRTSPGSTGGKFFCPHCGAIYEVTLSPGTGSESNITKCVICLRVMNESVSTEKPIYELIQRPETHSDG
jgi:hypothetical protein